jgi:predicted short-subunit dehydrogenase-like oxidoreductase (DUF2520 family)
MNIVLIGSGNVAWNLGKLFISKGHEVVQILSRNAATATELAYELNTESANYYSILNRNADIYIIAVKDDAIETVVNELKGLNKLVVHTSGVMAIDVLAACGNQYGILYPLQSLVYGAKEVPVISFLVQGSDGAVTTQLQQFVEGMQMDVGTMNSDDKAKLHVAAVLVNNFTHHLYVLAQGWCKQHGLDFALLLPLITETAQRVAAAIQQDEHTDLRKLQTGPAARGDQETIDKHLALMWDSAPLRELYQLLSDSIKSR